MKFRKKPVIIEAVQWLGHNFWTEIVPFTKKAAAAQDGSLYISTLEGVIRASIGDWIIKGIKEEFYPCKPDIFEITYERVKE